MDHPAIITALAHQQNAFAQFQTQISFMIDIKGPDVAAQLCDRKAREVDEFLSQAYEIGAPILQAAGLKDVPTAGLEAWVRQLRQQSRALRRHIAVT